MVKKQILDLKRLAMKDIKDIQEIEEIERLENEYDLQKASVLERKLRLMIEDNPDLNLLRAKLRKLIKEYEDKYWSDLENIPDSRIADSDKAEELVDAEIQFINKRKQMIRKKLKEYDMTQQDLGVLLGHPKTYMSELMNGVSHFTMKDLVIIHRVFGIRLKNLIPVYLQSETRDKIRASIRRLNKPKLRLKKKELI
jgi:transcriptional regulator with XRE-family HTH domain